MKAILYTKDMEPITVLEVTPAIQSYFDRSPVVYLACLSPVSFTERTIIPRDVVRKVCIWREPLFVYGRRNWLFFTNDDENALLLRSAFLPGQTAEVNRVQQTAFMQGFLAAWSRLGE